MPVASSTSGIFGKSPQWGNCTGRVNADELIHGNVNSNNLTSHVDRLTERAAITPTITVSVVSVVFDD